MTRSLAEQLPQRVRIFRMETVGSVSLWRDVTFKQVCRYLAKVTSARWRYHASTLFLRAYFITRQYNQAHIIRSWNEIEATSTTEAVLTHRIMNSNYWSENRPTEGILYNQAIQPILSRFISWVTICSQRCSFKTFRSTPSQSMFGADLAISLCKCLLRLRAAEEPTSAILLRQPFSLTRITLIDELESLLIFAYASESVW